MLEFFIIATNTKSFEKKPVNGGIPAIENMQIENMIEIVKFFR